MHKKAIFRSAYIYMEIICVHFLLSVYLIYMWVCTINYIQIIKELLERVQTDNRRDKRRILKQNLARGSNQITVGLFSIGQDEEGT